MNACQLERALQRPLDRTKYILVCPRCTECLSLKLTWQAWQASAESGSGACWEKPTTSPTLQQHSIAAWSLLHRYGVSIEKASQTVSKVWFDVGLYGTVHSHVKLMHTVCVSVTLDISGALLLIRVLWWREYYDEALIPWLSTHDEIIKLAWFVPARRLHKPVTSLAGCHHSIMYTYLLQTLEHGTRARLAQDM